MALFTLRTAKFWRTITNYCSARCGTARISCFDSRLSAFTQYEFLAICDNLKVLISAQKAKYYRFRIRDTIKLSAPPPIRTNALNVKQD